MNDPTNPNPLPKRVSKESRRPFGSSVQKLYYPPREQYHRHWFNEEPGRIDSALAAGYTHVQDKEGKKVQRVVGVASSGGALNAFLMEIPEEWYKEDMARQQSSIDEMDSAIRRGKVAATPGDNQYVPSQGISIKDGRSGGR